MCFEHKKHRWCQFIFLILNFLGHPVFLFFMMKVAQAVDIKFLSFRGIINPALGTKMQIVVKILN